MFDSTFLSKGPKFNTTVSDSESKTRNAKQVTKTDKIKK